MYNLSILKILIVDPNKYMCRLYKEVLRALGVCDIGIAPDADRAIAMLEQDQYDIIFTELALSGTNGAEFTQIIRESRELVDPYTPIIISTAYSEPHNVMQARDAGVSEFLVKPLKAKDIYARIKSLIEEPRDFVKTKTYKGPCRRRHTDADYAGVKRCVSDYIADNRGIIDEAVTATMETEVMIDDYQ